MEKKDHNLKDKIPPIGLMEYVRSQTETTEDIDIRAELLRTWRPPNTDLIICGTEAAELFQSILNQK